LCVVTAATVATEATVVARATVVETAIAATVATESATVVVARATVIVAALGTCGTLYVAFGLGKERTTGEFELIVLLVDVDEFNIDFVTLVEDVANILYALPINLGNVEQAFLAGENLDERAKLND
jgi:hypothetical protein